MSVLTFRDNFMFVETIYKKLCRQYKNLFQSQTYEQMKKLYTEEFGDEFIYGIIILHPSKCLINGNSDYLVDLTKNGIACVVFSMFERNEYTSKIDNILTMDAKFCLDFFKDYIVYIQTKCPKYGNVKKFMCYQIFWKKKFIWERNFDMKGSVYEMKENIIQNKCLVR